MKKIIHGKLYDTDTAAEIACDSNGYGFADFRYCREALYRKKNGEYFLYGEGGALSPYAQKCRGGSCEGSRIRPLTEESAKTWGEQHLDADSYMKVFGPVEE